MTIPQAFALALQHHQAGRLPEAEALYRQILAANPRHSDALHLLGVIAHQVGHNEVAIDLIRQAIALAPSVPDSHSNLGEACRAAGHMDAAIAAYRQAIALKPDFPAACCNLGNALRDKGQPDQAIAAYRQAIALKPNYAEAHCNLGTALRDKGHLNEAIAAYRQALVFEPNFAIAYNNLGASYRDIGQFDEAIAACRQAVALQPSYAEAYSNLGNAFKDVGLLDDAIVACRQAITLKSDSPVAHDNLGNALKERGELDEAIAAYREAIALKPDYAEAHCNLGNALKNTGELDEAIAAYRQALTLKPEYPEAHSNLLLVLNNSPGFDAQVVAEEHQRWNRQHAEPLRALIQPHANDRNPERRLRIGYVSPDFREHPVAFFLEGLLEMHDRSQMEVFCYSDVTHPDGVTARLEQSAAHWRKIAGLPNPQFADLIRNDGIDILVDLAGHTGCNRLMAFARKPAPIQVTWLGYPNTSGMNAMDYRFTDAFADPPGNTEHLHSEKLVRLPETFACFRPAQGAPPVGPLPAQARGHVTFGSFHTLAKLNDSLLKHWANILNEVAGSRLLLMLGGINSRSCRQRFTAFFEKRGIASGRIEFKERQTLAQYLALHNDVDILLDSHPFNGHTMACHALWMGVPVVTLTGPVHCSRMVASVLANIGLPELITQAPEHYVQVACQLARDLPHLAGLRSTLRDRMQASRLLDAPRFARSVEAAFRQMWLHWCENSAQPADAS